MTHNHPIRDDERRFVINSVARTVTIPESHRPVLIQHDHNSEHITFECDRFVEGHDLLLCDKVEVHYRNVMDGRHSVKGVYPVEDLKVSGADSNKLIFTWVVSLNATNYSGPLLFVVAFSCTKEGEILYRWNTNICKDLVVSEGMDNGEAITQNYSDVLEMWRLNLFGIGDTEEAAMKAVSQQQQEAIIAKGNQIAGGIPDSYVDLQNEVNMVMGSIDKIVNASLNADNINEVEVLSLTLINECHLNTEGVRVTPVDKAFYATSRTPINPGDILIVSGYNYAENPTYAFFDSTGKMIGRNLTYNVAAGTLTKDEVVIAPRSAASIAINGYTVQAPVLKRVLTHSEPRHKYLGKLVDSLIGDSVISEEPVEFTQAGSRYLQNGEVLVVESGNPTFIATDPVAVAGGELYKVKCGAFKDCDAYAFYNEQGDVLDKHTASASYEGFEGVLLVPNNAKTMRLSTAGDLGPIELYKVRSFKGKKWAGKKWVAVGDSLTESNSRTDKNYHDYISEETGIEVANMGVSGSGYLKTNNQNTAFYQRMYLVDADADVVTIFGSGNDMSAGAQLGEVTDTTTTTICGAINVTLNRLLELNPMVNLGVITPTPWIGYKPGDNNLMEQYANAIVTICKNRGIPCLDLYHCSGLRPWEEKYRELAYSKDDGNGVHPDETGHKIIACRIKAFLETLMF